MAEEAVFTQVETYVRSEPPRDLLYVVGEVTPGQKFANTQKCISFRVAIKDEAGKLVDTFEASREVMFKQSGQGIPVRFWGAVAADPENAKNVSTEIFKSRCSRDKG